MTSTFQVGDCVTWASQAAGYSKTKSGTVEEVVPVMSLPSRARFLQLYRGAGVGHPRDHVSYVVRVPGKTAKSAGTVYWPRVSGLAALPSIDQVLEAARSVTGDGGWIVVAGASLSGKSTTLQAVARGLVVDPDGGGILSIQDAEGQWASGCSVEVVGHEAAGHEWTSLATRGFEVIALDEGSGSIPAQLLERVLSMQSPPKLAIAMLAGTGEIAVARLRDHCPSLKGRPVLAVTVSLQSSGAHALRYVVRG